MEPLYVKVTLFDPRTSEFYPVFEDLELEIVKLNEFDPMGGEDPVQLEKLNEQQLFYLNKPQYTITEKHFIRVSFKKVNFSKKTNKLHSTHEIQYSMSPIYCPGRIPKWDSGWDDGYQTNEYFDEFGIKVKQDINNPILLNIPIREIFNIGHRGAPHHFPENTIASFEKALDLGANGLEFDLCITKDQKIAVFHDPKPVKHPSQVDRTQFENLMYELVSPEFSSDGKIAIVKELKSDKYDIRERIKLNLPTDFDLENLTLEQIRDYYRYQHVKGVEHSIPELEEFLTFVAQNKKRIQFLFFDVKNPGWDPLSMRDKFIDFGNLLGKTILKFDSLPEHLVICNPDQTVLSYLKESILSSGEQRCDYAYDAEGSFGALLGLQEDPIQIASKMENAVISIGSLFRPGNLEEIKNATRNRDYDKESRLKSIIHWTLNDPSQMYNSFAAGVNGIVTDNPDTLRDMMMKMGLKLPD